MDDCLSRNFRAVADLPRHRGAGRVELEELEPQPGNARSLDQLRERGMPTRFYTVLSSANLAHLDELLRAAEAAGVIDSEERASVVHARETRGRAVAVDAFTLEELRTGVQEPSLAQAS